MIEEEPDTCVECRNKYSSIEGFEVGNRCATCISWPSRKMWLDDTGQMVDANECVIDDDKLTYTIDWDEFTTALRSKNKNLVNTFLSDYELKEPRELFLFFQRNYYTNVELLYYISVLSDVDMIKKIISYLTRFDEPILKYLLLNSNLTLEQVVDIGYENRMSVTAINHKLRRNIHLVYSQNEIQMIRKRIYHGGDSLSPEHMDRLDAMIKADSSTQGLSLIDLLSFNEYEAYEDSQKKHDIMMDGWKEEMREFKEQYDYELNTIPGLVETIRNGKHHFTEKHRYANLQVRHVLTLLKEEAKTEEIPEEILAWFERDERKYVQSDLAIIKRRNAKLRGA